MANIYTERAKTVRTPQQLDTGLMEGFERKRQQGLDIVGKSIEHAEAQQAAEEKSLMDQTETSAMQVYKNGYTIHGDNQQEYAKFVGEGLEKIYAEVPDSREKARIMAKVGIAGTGYNARVQKNAMDNREKLIVEREKDNTFASIDSAKAGLSGLFASQDTNLSPEQQIEQRQAFDDAQIPLFNAYQKRNNQDRNGNFIYSKPERALIEDAWENRGSYALLDYASDNITNNRNGVVELRNSLVENKKDVQERYNISDEQFAKTLSGMDKIVKGQTTAEDLQKAESIQLVNSATVKDMEINVDGTVDNSEFANIDSMINVYKQLKASTTAYTTNTDREKLAKEKGKVSRAIIKDIEDGANLKDRRSGFQKFLKRKPNVGETAVIEIDKNIEKLSQSYMFQQLDKDEQDNIKAGMYIEVLGGLQDAEEIDLKDNDNPKGKEIAKKIATGTYYKQIEGIVGYKVKASDPDNPESVKLAYDDALMQHSNKVELASIRARLGVI